MITAKPYRPRWHDTARKCAGCGCRASVELAIVSPKRDQPSYWPDLCTRCAASVVAKLGRVVETLA